MKHLNLLFALFLISHLLLMNTSCCEILDNCEDPVPEHAVGDTLWTHDFTGVDSFFMGSSIAEGIDGTIYYGKGGGQAYWHAGRIVALNPVDGSNIWVSPGIDHIIPGTIVVGDDGTVYVIGYYKLYSINPSNGQFNWVWECPQNLPNPDGSGELGTYGQIGSLALTNDGDLVLGSGGSGSYSRAIYCISHTTGFTKWYNIKANGLGIDNGIVVGKNDRLFYNSQILTPQIGYEQYLVSLDAGTGSLLWSKKIINISSAANNIIIDDDGFLICSYKLIAGDQFKMHRIDPSDGSIVWSSTDESDHSIKLLSKNGTIYQQNHGGIFKFNPGQGTKDLYGTDVNYSIAGAAINNNDQLLIMHSIGWNTNINTYDNSGVLNWSIPMVNLRNNPFLITDEKVIVAIQTTGICALQGDAKLADSGWPKHGHDNRNTFNVTK